MEKKLFQDTLKQCKWSTWTLRGGRIKWRIEGRRCNPGPSIRAAPRSGPRRARFAAAVFVKFSGARTKYSADPASGIFAHFIICLLHKLLLNGKQMDGQQVWEQMALLGEEEKLRAERQRVLEGGSVPLPHGRRLPRDLLRRPVLLVGSSHLC